MDSISWLSELVMQFLGEYALLLRIPGVSALLPSISGVRHNIKSGTTPCKARSVYCYWGIDVGAIHD